MQDLSLLTRHLFDFPPARNGHDIIELRALTHGLPPKAIQQNLALFAKEWAMNGVDAWNDMKESSHLFLVGDENEEEKNRTFGWWALPEIIGDRFISRLLHVPENTCIMLQSATQIVFSILSCKELNQPGRRKVICTDGEFPAVLHSLHHFNRQFEAYPEHIRKELQLDIHVVEMGNEPFDDQKILSEIDDTTALVIFSHVGFVRGECVPDTMIRSISTKAHQHGALVALDAYHAIGNHVLSVEKLDVDVYFGGLLKEGCGSAGNCFLYIRPGLELTPSISGWFGDKKPFDFDLEPETNASVRRRFLTGTFPVACFYHAVEGLKIMFQVGLENVEKDVLDKTEQMTKDLLADHIHVVSPHTRDRMSSLIVIQVPDANKLREYLSDVHGILVDARRNTFLRLALHMYNSKAEAQRATHIISEAISSGDYLQHAVASKSGPVT